MLELQSLISNRSDCAKSDQSFQKREDYLLTMINSLVLYAFHYVITTHKLYLHHYQFLCCFLTSRPSRKQ